VHIPKQYGLVLPVLNFIRYEIMHNECIWGGFLSKILFERVIYVDSCNYDSFLLLHNIPPYDCIKNHLIIWVMGNSFFFLFFCLCQGNYSQILLPFPHVLEILLSRTKDIAFQRLLFMPSLNLVSIFHHTRAQRLIIYSLLVPFKKKIA
jgi:hypothetical protein